MVSFSSVYLLAVVDRDGIARGVQDRYGDQRNRGEFGNILKRKLRINMILEEQT